MTSDLKVTIQKKAELPPQQKKLNRLIDKIEQQKISLATWQNAQDKIQQHTRQKLFPVYAELHTVLFQQMQQLWNMLHNHEFSKAEMQQLDEKIASLGEILKHSKSLSAEQQTQVAKINTFYQQVVAQSNAKKSKKSQNVSLENQETPQQDEFEREQDFEQYAAEQRQAREQAKQQRLQQKRTDDLTYLMGRFFDSLMGHDELGLHPTSEQYEAIQDGDYFLKRVDINQSWHLKNRDEVLAWIRSAGACARLKHRGVGQYTGDTLYFAKNSRRWSAKCYSKGHEINAKNHKLPEELQIPELLDWADKSLRIELVLRSMQLKDMFLNKGSNWCADTAKMLLCSLVLDNLEITDNMALPDDLLSSLPTRLKGIYALWLNGEDLRQSLPKNTFYRYRRQFLEHNIDISIINEKQRNNIIPLVRYLEAQPAEIPVWAYQKGLVA